MSHPRADGAVDARGGAGQVADPGQKWGTCNYMGCCLRRTVTGPFSRGQDCGTRGHGCSCGSRRRMLRHPTSGWAMKDNRGTVGGRPNGKRVPPEVKQRFLELIHEGVSIREASRIVGINRRTGQEWTSGRGARVRTTKAGRKTVRAAIQPVVGDSREFEFHPRAAERNGSRTISARFLSEEERVRIADLRRERKSIRVIAGELNRGPSTISREIRRNGSSGIRPNHPAQYRPFSAHKRAQARLPRPKNCGTSSRPGWMRSEPRAERAHPPSGLPGPSRDAGDTRDDLPNPICPG